MKNQLYFASFMFEKVDLMPLSRDECNEVMVKKGFRRKLEANMAVAPDTLTMDGEL